jgi:hypothetical protein
MALELIELYLRDLIARVSLEVKLERLLEADDG